MKCNGLWLMLSLVMTMNVEAGNSPHAFGTDLGSDLESDLGGVGSVARSGRSFRQELGRLSVYHLEGNLVDAARTAGELLPARARRRNMAHYFSDYVSNRLSNTDFFDGRGFLKLLLGPFLSYRYYWPMRSKMTTEEKRAVAALARAIGMKRRALERAYMNTDVFAALARDYLTGNFLPPFLDFGRRVKRLDSLRSNAAPFGCTTFAAGGAWSADGKLVIGRGQDYPGLGLFDGFPSLYFHRRPGGYDYVSIITAPVAFGAITAMNEHGLTMSVHSGPSLMADRGGYPLMSTSREMMEQAKSIEEAVRVCNRKVPAGSWIMNVFDTSKGYARAARIEINPQKKVCHAVVQSNWPFVSNNHFFKKEHVAQEIEAAPSWGEDSRARRRRALQLVQRHRGRMDVPRAIQVLADRFDSRMGRYAGHAPSAISPPDQVLALVMKPETREIWVSDGRMPAAARGTYYHFKWEDFKSVARLQDRQSRQDIRAADAVAGTRSGVARFQREIGPMTRVMIALDPHATVRVDRAARAIKGALRANSSEPLYQMLDAFLRLKQGKTSEALRPLQDLAQSTQLDAHRRHVVRLALARTFDALGWRNDAMGLYHELQADASVYSGIRVQAATGLEEVYDGEKFKKLQIDPKYVDLGTYD